MGKSGSSKSLIRQGWLRVLLYLITLILLTGVGLGIYFIGIKKINPAFSSLLSQAKGDHLLFITALLLIISLLVTFIFRRWVDRKSFISLGLDFQGHGKDAMAGSMLAVFIICSGSILLKWTGHLKWMDIIFDPKALFLAFGTIIIIAFYEELIFRGYVLSNLMDSFPKWLALLISALLFMVFHWTGQSSIGFFSLANMLIMGLIAGLNYIYTRNIWFSICFHIGWKFLEGPVFGFTGDESFQTLLQPELKGDENITGGANGLEGSVFLMAISLLSLVALFLFLQKKFNPRSLPVPGRI
jgi:uncharacterized protein